jgi:flagellar hook-associated protein 1 FlgK
MDEETTNIIVYQQTYKACARVISAIDEMLETLINSF